MHLSDIDLIYISYDEPNADKNYADLLNKAPWAKRIHGVKGSDSAHKAAANLSETERFISVDGDNIVDPSFFEQDIDFADTEKSVISWCGKNIVNGLIYGNGGLKCWPKDLVLNMRTHENADPGDIANKIEFCWGIDYKQMNTVYSVAHVNGSPLQSFRAGFREGVKMSLDQGKKVDKFTLKKSIYIKNYHRLCIWQSVGSDVPNGLWSIYGARLGCYMTNCSDWDYINVRDFEWINDFFNNQISQNVTEETLEEETIKIGKRIRKDLNMDICDLDQTQSKFFKEMYVNPLRSNIGLE
jgi:hypothetical protein